MKKLLAFDFCFTIYMGVWKEVQSWYFPLRHFNSEKTMNTNNNKKQLPVQNYCFQ